MSRHTLPYVPGLVRLMDIDIAAQNKVDWDAYGELRSVEAENPSTSVTSLDFKTISSNDMLHSRKAASCHQWSPEEEPAVEIEGFGIWESFMKCYAGVDGDHDTKECQGTDTLKDSRFEVDLKEIING